MIEWFDPDIRAAALEIQTMRDDGKLKKIHQIILHCQDGQIKLVQAEAALRSSDRSGRRR